MKLIDRDAFYPEDAVGRKPARPAAKASKGGKAGRKAAGKARKGGATEASPPSSSAASPALNPLRASALSDIAIVIAARTQPERGCRIAAALLREAEEEGREGLEALMTRLVRLADLGAPRSFCEVFLPLGQRIGDDASFLPTTAVVQFLTRVIGVVDMIRPQEAKKFWDALRNRELRAGSPKGCDSAAFRFAINMNGFDDWAEQSGGFIDEPLRHLRSQLSSLTTAEGGPASPEHAADAAFAVLFAEFCADRLLADDIETGDAHAKDLFWIAERAAAYRCGVSATAEARAAECAWRALEFRKAAAHAVKAVEAALAGAPEKPLSDVRSAEADKPDDALFSKLDESDADRQAGLARAQAVLYGMFEERPDLPAKAAARLKEAAAKPYPDRARTDGRIFWLFAAQETNAVRELQAKDGMEAASRLLLDLLKRDPSSLQPAAEILSWGAEKRRSADGVEALCAALALANYTNRIGLCADFALDPESKAVVTAAIEAAGAAIDELLSGERFAAAAGSSAAAAMIEELRCDSTTAITRAEDEAFQAEKAAAEKIRTAEGEEGKKGSRTSEAKAGEKSEEPEKPEKSDQSEKDLAEVRHALANAEVVIKKSLVQAEASCLALERLPKGDCLSRLAIDATKAAFDSARACALMAYGAWTTRRREEHWGDPKAMLLWDPCMSLALERTLEGEYVETLRKESEQSLALLHRVLCAVGPDRAPAADWEGWIRAAGSAFAGLAASAEGDFFAAEAAERLLAVLRATKSGWGHLHAWRKTHGTVLLYLGRWQEAAAAFWSAIQAPDAAREPDVSEAILEGGLAYEAWRHKMWTDAWKRVLLKGAAQQLAPLGRTAAVLSREDGRPPIAHVVPKAGIGAPAGVEFLATVGAATLSPSSGREENQAIESEMVLPIEAGAALPWWAAASADPLSALPSAFVSGDALWTMRPDPEEAADRQFDQMLFDAAEGEDDDEDEDDDFGWDDWDDSDDDEDNDEDGVNADGDGFSMGPPPVMNAAFLAAAGAAGTVALPSAAWRALRSPEAKDAWLARTAGIAAAALERGLMTRSERWTAAFYDDLFFGAPIKREPQDFGGFAGLLFANADLIFGSAFPTEIREGFDSRGPFRMSLAKTPFAAASADSRNAALRTPPAPPAAKPVSIRSVPLRAALPLYEEELRFVNFYGLEALLDRAAEQGVPLAPARRGRPNVCEGVEIRPVIGPEDVREVIPAPLGEQLCFVTPGVLLQGRVDAGVRIPADPDDPEGKQSGWIFFLAEEALGGASTAACFAAPLNAPATLEPGLKFLVDLPAPAMIRRQPDGSFCAVEASDEDEDAFECFAPESLHGWGRGFGGGSFGRA